MDVESNLRGHLVARNQKLDRFMRGEMVTFTEKCQGGVKRVERPLVYVDNIDELITEICLKREIGDSPIHIKIGLDGGKNHLKVMMSIVRQDQVQIQEQKNQSSIFLDSGSKRAIILAIVPHVSESYENLKTIFNYLKIEHSKKVLFSFIGLLNFEK